jgi:predicted transcriptional regulator
LLGLPDRAVALYYIIEELGGNPSFDELMQITGKSQATLYRALADLFDAGIPLNLSQRVKTKSREGRRYYGE